MREKAPTALGGCERWRCGRKCGLLRGCERWHCGRRRGWQRHRHAEFAAHPELLQRAADERLERFAPVENRHCIPDVANLLSKRFLHARRPRLIDVRKRRGIGRDARGAQSRRLRLLDARKRRGARRGGLRRLPESTSESGRDEMLKARHTCLPVLLAMQCSQEEVTACGKRPAAAEERWGSRLNCFR
jgi:hypothetical protein